MINDKVDANVKLFWAV